MIEQSSTPRYSRHHTEHTNRTDIRAPGERDRDRILYSSAFRRLSRVTQVVSPDERQVLHNRLTHSLEVAQVARGVANWLISQSKPAVIVAVGGIDPYVVEAAALAHDLGHPPFGHVAELELNRLLVDAGVSDGFEGNAQSFRVITRLSSRFPLTPGLNLTRATLNAVLKYPWLRSDPRAEKGRHAKWGAYDSESDELTWAIAFNGSTTRSTEAAIMDWADDIAYAVSDLEDFVRAGLIPLALLTDSEEERNDFIESELRVNRGFAGDELALRIEALQSLLAFTPKRYDGSRIDRAMLRGCTSSLISRYISSTELVSDPSPTDHLSVRPEAVLEVDVLKGLTWHYVIRRSSLATLRFGQRRIIEELFEIFRKGANSDSSIFPSRLREMLSVTSTESDRLRIVSDAIASMSESQTIEIHQRLTGRSLGSAMDDVLS